MFNKEKQLNRGNKDYRYLSARQLMWRKFLHHRIAVISAIILIFIYIIIIFAGFFAPYNMSEPHSEYLYSPPHRLRFIDDAGNFSFRPFVYKTEGYRDPETLLFVYEDITNIKYYVKFFIQGEKYKLFGFYETDLHMFGVEFIIMFLGSTIGTISGFYGGWVDNIIQRFIEILRIFPRLALWMALAAAIPPNWPSTFVYLGIVVVLGFIGWPGLAREVRGKVLVLRESEFIAAARISGANTGRIIFKHLLPNIASHIIVIGTLAIPYLIIGESALSFLGLGIKPPMISWGLLLSQANKIQVLRLYPWMLIPGLFIIISVLCFNYVCDALRDVIDPYAK